jgi:hypothetical protein
MLRGENFPAGKFKHSIFPHLPLIFVFSRKWKVMKELVKKMKSFIAFDFPFQTANITAQFANTQRQQQKEIPGWSTTATRQKLINSYWFTYVVGHYALVLGLPAVILFLASGSFEQRYLSGVFLAGILSYPALYLFLYRPNFGSIYLPRLETVKEAYERKELEQLEKCRKTQLSNQALCLIFYVFDQTSGINELQPNDRFAGLLMKLYGVDRGSLRTNLELIMGGLGKRNNLTDRKRTEIGNRFAEAYQFFEELNFTQGIELLRKLELRMF